jgi:hypothetical protein
MSSALLFQLFISLFEGRADKLPPTQEAGMVRLMPARLFHRVIPAHERGSTRGSACRTIE